MVKRRRLQDLYVTGTAVHLDDGAGEVEVWVQKLTPVDHETAMRRANAARARCLTVKKSPDSEEYQSCAMDVYETDDDALIAEIVEGELAQKRLALEAELAADEEWSKDDYLQGLEDAWSGGLNMTYGESPDDPEAKRVFIELKRFTDTVDEHLEDERQRLLKDRGTLSREELEERVIKERIETIADLEWMKEYRKCELWLSLRDPEDHNKRYFRQRPEVDELAQEVLGPLVRAYQDLAVEVLEGKDSGETPDSSPSSEPSTPGEGEQLSGQEGAAA
jgi:hypothetical protein